MHPILKMFVLAAILITMWYSIFVVAKAGVALARFHTVIIPTVMHLDKEKYRVFKEDTLNTKQCLDVAGGIWVKKVYYLEK
ncbi:MAG: hypothetical protein HQK96_06950 [Nitrospirae bacterium]|nr:hypothetical protein [Nitrospirota bacterium]